MEMMCLGPKGRTADYQFVRSVLILLVVLAVGCAQEPVQGGALPTAEPTLAEPTSTGGAPSFSMDIELGVSKAPALNEETDLEYTITSVSDNPGSLLEITLPEGVELVSGELTKTFDIKEGEDIEGSIRIKAVAEGEWKIKGLIVREEGLSRMGGSDRLILLVTEDAGKVKKTTFRNSSAVEAATDALE